MAQSNETLSVESALAAYAAVGPGPFIGELPPESEQWQQASAERELSSEETLRFAWLSLERGFHELHAVDRLRDRARGGGRSKGGHAPSIAGGGSRQAEGHRLVEQAQDWLEVVLDDDDAPEYVQAQAALTFGAVPYIQALRAGASRLKLDQQRKYFTLGQASAVSDISDAIANGELSPDGRAFSRLLAVSVIANNLRANDMLVLPAPPRCYEGQPYGEGWHAVFWNMRKNKELPVALAGSTTVPDALAILSSATPEDQIDEQAMQLILDLRRAMQDEAHGVPPESELGKAVVGWAGIISQLTKRRQLAIFDVPDLVPYSVEAGPPIEVVVETDITPLVYSEINFSKISELGLLDWYGEQVNPRALTYQEGLQLNKLLDGYDALQVSRLSLEEQLVLNRIRLECSLALADRYGPAANRQLDIADRHLKRIQKEGQAARNPAVVFEAAVDVLRLQLLGSTIKGEASETTADDLIAELSELIVEIDFEKRRTGKREIVGRLETQMSAALNAVLAMRFTSDNSIIALPTFGREKGNTEIPGWDVDAWRVGDNGTIDMASRRKLRMSGDVDHPMRQGDIGIIPTEVIRKTAPIKFIAENLISYTKEDERKRRAGKLIDRWSGNLRPVFDEALALIA